MSFNQFIFQTESKIVTIMNTWKRLSDSDAEPFDDTVCPTGCSLDLFNSTIEEIVTNTLHFQYDF